MSLRIGLYAILGLGVFLLPLVCLCQFIPGQTDRAPYLLLFPQPHHAAPPTISDADLFDLAFTTGQAVTLTDEGDLTLGYGAGTPLPSAPGGPTPERSPAPPERHPTLTATLPGDPPLVGDSASWQERARGPVLHTQYDPARPDRPPCAA